MIQIRRSTLTIITQSNDDGGDDDVEESVAHELMIMISIMIKVLLD